MSIDFNFYINRQGARGRQGVKGEAGFSPVVTVNTNTATEYTLNIETIDGVLTTPNLKSTPLNYIAGAGNYVMFDPSTQQIYNSDVPDELVLRTDLATVDAPGIIQIADDEDFDEDADDVAVTPKQLNDAIEGVEREIPTDYVDLTSNQNVGGNKNFAGTTTLTGDLDADGSVNLSGLTTIDGQYQQVNFKYQVNGSNRYMIVQRDDDNHLRISNTSVSYNARVLNETDVDGDTVWINAQGQLQAKGEEFPDVIDGGIEQPGTKVFTITTNSADITISNPSVTVTQSTPGTTTVTYSNASNDSTYNLTINYTNNSVVMSGTIRTLDPETSRWIELSISNLEILNDTTTTYGMFTFDPLALTIAVNP